MVRRRRVQGLRKPLSGRCASSRANTRAASSRCGRTARSSSAARPSSTWCWSRTWCRASTRRSPPTSTSSRSRTSGSTNGTFVNGEKVRKAELKDGDRILIGTSIIKLVSVDGERHQPPDARPRRARSWRSTANKRHARPSRCRAASRRSRCPICCSCCRPAASPACWSCAPTARVGKIYLRKGQIYFASIDDSFNIGPRKAIFRMLTWTQGSFELEPPDERAVLEEMQDSTEGLLMEGMRQLDEYQVQLEKLPPLASPLARPAPAEPKLRELSPRGAGRLPGGAGGEDRRGAVRPVVADRPRDRGEAGHAVRKRLPRRRVRSPAPLACASGAALVARSGSRLAIGGDAGSAERRNVARRRGPRWLSVRRARRRAATSKARHAEPLSNCTRGPRVSGEALESDRYPCSDRSTASL